MTHIWEIIFSVREALKLISELPKYVVHLTTLILEGFLKVRLLTGFRGWPYVTCKLPNDVAYISVFHLLKQYTLAIWHDNRKKAKFGNFEKPGARTLFVNKATFHFKTFKTKAQRPSFRAKKLYFNLFASGPSLFPFLCVLIAFLAGKISLKSRTSGKGRAISECNHEWQL